MRHFSLQNRRSERDRKIGKFRRNATGAAAAHEFFSLLLETATKIVLTTPEMVSTFAPDFPFRIYRGALPENPEGCEIRFLRESGRRTFSTHTSSRAGVNDIGLGQQRRAPAASGSAPTAPTRAPRRVNKEDLRNRIKGIQQELAQLTRQEQQDSRERQRANRDSNRRLSSPRSGLPAVSTILGIVFLVFPWPRQQTSKSVN